MTNGEDFAYPQFGNNGGMTKREEIAIKAMQGLLSDPNVKESWITIATASVNMADALIEALNNTEQST